MAITPPPALGPRYSFGAAKAGTYSTDPATAPGFSHQEQIMTTAQTTALPTEADHQDDPAATFPTIEEVVDELIRLREADHQEAAQRNLARDVDQAAMLRRIEALEARRWWHRPAGWLRWLAGA